MPIELTSNIVPKNNGSFPTHEAIYGRGGRREVDTLSDRDGIPAARRTAGMQVYVRADQKTYVLQVNLTAWVEDPLATRIAAVESTLSSLNKGSVGLGNVDNTADTAKPVSTAQAAAISSAVSASGANFLVKSTRQLKNVAYTALIGDLLTLDTTAGTFVATIPAASTGKGRIAIKWALGTAAPTIQLSGADTFDKTGGSTTILPTYLNQSYILESDGVSIWTITEGDPAFNLLLAANTGSQRIGHSRTPLVKDLTTISDYMNTSDGGAVSVWEYVDLITVKPNLNDFSTWDWKPAIDAALNNSKRVILTQRDGTLAYRSSPVNMSRGDAELIIPASQNLIFTNVPDGGSGLTISGDFAKVYGGVIRTDNPLSNIIDASGFRTLIWDVKAGTGTQGGCRTALVLSGAEAIVMLGRFRSGTQAGIEVKAVDAYMLNAYCDNNRVGLRSDGFGSITAHHLHAASNQKWGVYLAGASFSQLVSLYADLNGENGFEIRDITANLTMIDCWGFKSSNLLANFYDFAFYNSKNVRVIGGQSSGQGGFTKQGSVRLQSDSTVSFIGFHAELPLVSDNGSVALQKSTFTDCGGTFKKYNKPQNRFVQGSNNVAATGGTVSVTVSTFVPVADIISPGNTMFQVRLLGRSSSGGSITIAGTFDVMVGLGGVTTLVIPHYASDLSISVPTLTDNGDATANLVFTITNANALPMQVAAFVDYFGTSRGTG